MNYTKKLILSLFLLGLSQQNYALFSVEKTAKMAVFKTKSLIEQPVKALMVGTIWGLVAMMNYVEPSSGTLAIPSAYSFTKSILDNNRVEKKEKTLVNDDEINKFTLADDEKAEVLNYITGLVEPDMTKKKEYIQLNQLTVSINTNAYFVSLLHYFEKERCQETLRDILLMLDLQDSLEELVKLGSLKERSELFQEKRSIKNFTGLYRNQ